MKLCLQTEYKVIAWEAWLYVYNVLNHIDHIHYFPKRKSKRKSNQIKEKFKGLEIFQNLKIKGEEKWRAKPLTFLQL